LAGTSATFSGLITAQAGILFNTTQSITTGGSIGFNSAQGLFIYGKTGSSYDLKLYNGVGSAFMQIPTGTQNVEILGALSGTTATFSGALNVGGNQTFTGVAGTTRYIITDESSTGTGRLVIQAGGGSAAFGGAINLYAASHPTYTGDVVVGLSATTGAKFRVNNSALDGGTNLLTIERTGAATFSSSLEVSGTVKNQAINTLKGVVSVPNATATTLYTFTAYGIYILYSDLINGQGVPTLYSAYAIIAFDGSVARIMQQTNGGVYTLTLSGNSIQATQTSGITQNCNYIFQLIGA
jgi:hypothetical protein